MKTHNASNPENVSVTLKADEVAEITTLGFNSLSIIQNLLDDIVELHDNGENCPMCGQEYNDDDGVCGYPDCVLSRAQIILREFSQTLHTLRNALTP